MLPKRAKSEALTSKVFFFSFLSSFFCNCKWLQVLQLRKLEAVFVSEKLILLLFSYPYDTDIVSVGGQSLLFVNVAQGKRPRLLCHRS